MNDEQLNQLARATAKLAGQMILTAPPLVRIEAAFMLVRAIFGVTSSRRNDSICSTSISRTYEATLSTN